MPADGEPSERELDGEGRCVLTVHGDLAILNVYVPAVTSDDDEKRDRRTDFKAAFLRALERRCHQLLDEGLRVLVVGDMNITPARIDSAREMQEAPEPSGSHSRPWRTWLSQLLNPPLDSGRTAFADCFRLLHPTQPRAYTCFHGQAAQRHSTLALGSTSRCWLHRPSLPLHPSRHHTRYAPWHGKRAMQQMRPMRPMCPMRRPRHKGHTRTHLSCALAALIPRKTDQITCQFG